MKVNRKQTFVFRKCDLLVPFFINYLKNKYRGAYFGWCLVVQYFSCKKGEFDRFFDRLDRPVEESRPDQLFNLTGFHLSAKPRRWAFRHNMATIMKIGKV